jgi:hypothetical protein
MQIRLIPKKSKVLTTALRTSNDNPDSVQNMVTENGRKTMVRIRSENEVRFWSENGESRIWPENVSFSGHILAYVFWPFYVDVFRSDSAIAVFCLENALGFFGVYAACHLFL